MPLLPATPNSSDRDYTKYLTHPRPRKRPSAQTRHPIALEAPAAAYCGLAGVCAAPARFAARALRALVRSLRATIRGSGCARRYASRTPASPSYSRRPERSAEGAESKGLAAAQAGVQASRNGIEAPCVFEDRNGAEPRRGKRREMRTAQIAALPLGFDDLRSTQACRQTSR